MATVTENQTSIEVLSQNNAFVRTTQVYTDIVWSAPPALPVARVTQVYLEIPHRVVAATIAVACPVNNQLTVGVPYSGTITVSGGTPPYTFALVGTLPPGLSLNSTTGVISGTPTTGGTFSYTVIVTDSAANTVTITCSLQIQAVISPTGPCPPVFELSRITVTLREARHLPVRGSTK